MDHQRLAQAMGQQAGVVARRQVLAAGFDDGFIGRQLHRRRWARVHLGVYVDHTGPCTWSQRAWAGVLFYWPAALCHCSALRAGGVIVGEPRLRSAPDRPEGDRDAVHVAIAHPRSAVKVDGVRLHRLVNLSARVLWNTHPPRLRLEEALLDVCADQPDRVAALSLVTDACQQGRTTATRVASALEARHHLRFGGWLGGALLDVAAGTLSVLEHAYLRRVERPHGLPRGHRQDATLTPDGGVHRDVEYDEFAVVVELDGRRGHERFADRSYDMDRDLVTATLGRLTIRLGWAQVDRRPCVTAGRIAVLLQQRGWTGRPRRCGPACQAA
jgi:hypothetical protein